MENIVQTNDGGQIVLKQFKDNVEYAIYVPPNVNPDTSIFTYVYGSGRKSGWYTKNGPYDALIQNGSDSIVIFPSMNWNDDWGKNTMEIVNSVRSEYGIVNNNISGGGFSYGGDGGYRVVLENLKQQGPTNLDPQIVYLIDDYSNMTYKGFNSTLSSDDINYFKENNTLFFTYENKASAATEAFAKAGLNIIKVKCDDGSHTGIRANFFRNGIYDYMAGDSLPLDGYTYQKAVVTVDPETGKQIVRWENIDISSIDTKEKLYNYYGLESKSSVKENDGFFAKLFDFFGDKAAILTNFSSGHVLSTNPSEVEQVCNYLRNDVCSQLDEMASSVNEAYQAVVDYAASSPYPVPVPAGFDKSAAISAIASASSACSEAATKVYNVSDIITRYSNGDWNLSNGTLTKIGDFIGFAAGVTNIGNDSFINFNRDDQSDDNNRFKFFI